jgi:hypothetical protein
MPLLLLNTQLPPTRSERSRQSNGIDRSCRAFAAAIPDEPAPMMQARGGPLESLERRPAADAGPFSIAELIARVGADAGPDVLGWALGPFVGVGVAREPFVPRRRRGRDVLSVAPGAQVAVDHPCALAALVDRPHDQRLAAARVACGKHAVHGRRIGLDRPNVAARVPLHAELLEQLRFGSEEAHRQPHQLRGQLALGARHRTERWLAGGAGDMQGRHPALWVG